MAESLTRPSFGVRALTFTAGFLCCFFVVEFAFGLLTFLFHVFPNGFVTPGKVSLCASILFGLMFGKLSGGDNFQMKAKPVKLMFILFGLTAFFYLAMGLSTSLDLFPLGAPYNPVDRASFPK